MILFNAPATTELYTLSLHDALPIYEVDRGDRCATGVFIEIRGPGQPAGEVCESGGFAAPEVPDSVSVGTVPLGPHRREAPDLVAPGPQVPGFGDQLRLGDQRVLVDQVEECREPVHLVELAGQGGGQGGAEPVHEHGGDPVPPGDLDPLPLMCGPTQHGAAGRCR